MSKEHHNNTLKIPLYGNCRVQNPDGVHIFNCGEKKAKWYLKRDLAEVVQSNPFVIRLKFVPNGQGHANDEFYLQERQNICVVCGTTEQLTKHHVVPYCYRRFFPDNLKNHTAYDVLPVCYNCHEKYEGFAQQFKKQLNETYGVSKENISIVNSKIKKVCLYATALVRQSGQIPKDRHDMMMNTIRSYYGKNEITHDDIEQAALLKYNTNREDFKHDGQVIVEKLNLDEIRQFIIMWRQHFVNHTAPKYMPKHWDVNRI